MNRFANQGTTSTQCNTTAFNTVLLPQTCKAPNFTSLEGAVALVLQSNCALSTCSRSLHGEPSRSRLEPALSALQADRSNKSATVPQNNLYIMQTVIQDVSTAAKSVHENSQQRYACNKHRPTASKLWYEFIVYRSITKQNIWERTIGL